MDTMETLPMFTADCPQAKPCDAKESLILPRVDPPACLGKVLLEFAKDPPTTLDPSKQLRANFKEADDNGNQAQGGASDCCSRVAFGVLCKGQACGYLAVEVRQVMLLLPRFGV